MNESATEHDVLIDFNEFLLQRKLAKQNQFFMGHNLFYDLNYHITHFTTKPKNWIEFNNWYNNFLLYFPIEVGL